MIRYVIAVAVVAAFAGCASRAETVGTGAGALGGAAVGSAVTGGSTMGTLGGAAVGGYVGNKAGEEYDKKHK
jgi:osmotically inducible lipoprotein OsmB